MNGLCSKCKGKLHLEDDDCNCLDLICKNLKERCIKAEAELTSLKQRIDGITVEELYQMLILNHKQPYKIQAVKIHDKYKGGA